MNTDPRNIETGYEIPSENYCDQPYIVIADDGAWVCVLTTGRGREGDRGQHVVSTRSTDQGKTWSPLVDIEPADGPESSWVMPLKVPSGRIYAIYNHNTDALEEVITDFGPTRRVDTLGHFQFKYSDDNGLSWSQERYRIPLRVTQIDRDNPYQGKVQFFWGVGKPIIHNGRAYVGFAKVGRFGHGFMATSEGYFLCSENVLTESDPAKIEWELLPDGEVGLRAVSDAVADEHNLVGLSDGSLYCTYRTIEGHPCHAS
ncbi:MAG TPA: sialidase family protein, partial [Spirillospora sp.]|nr:sialidase family protein [Spirillospora sp.]